MDGHLGDLLNRFAKSGKVEWIGLRPARRATMDVVQAADVQMSGLTGDRRRVAGKRAVTLIQLEHLSVIASLANLGSIQPEQLRRNIVVSGINLLALRNKSFQIGEVVLQGSGLCAPCSRMEEELGFGGYTAVRGHGGITASVVSPGRIVIGDKVAPTIDN